MNFGSSQRVATSPGMSKGRSSEAEEAYVPYYKTPPAGKMVTVPEFESLSFERLKLLALFEDSGVFYRNSDFEKVFLTSHANLSASPENLEKDALSHWALKLAFAMDSDLRRRYVDFEMFLLRFRFEKLSTKQVARFMVENGLKYFPISQTEKKQYRDDLLHYFRISKEFTNSKSTEEDFIKSFDTEKYYKVNWIEVPDLVSKRKVFISKGKAFVPRTHIAALVLSRYRAHLNIQLVKAYKTFYNEDIDLQIGEALKSVLKRIQSADFSRADKRDSIESGFEKLTLNNIPISAKRGHFPPCMQQCSEKLQRAHHLQYHARVQYRLFLKAAGLDLANALEYFKRGFNLDSGSFEKKYAYNVRHSYGKEGRRLDYSARSCAQIINSANQPTSSQVHGCPFKTLSFDKLRTLVDNDSTILQLAKTKKYQMACKTLFMKRHNATAEQTADVGNHPNSWYVESVRLRKERSEPVKSSE